MVKKETAEEKKRHDARRRSIEEGIFATARFSFGDRYIAPFAIAINSSNAIVAMLSSVGGLLGPLTQLFSSRLIEKHSRKKIVLTSVFFEALTWLPLIVIAILFYKEVITNILPLFLLLSFALFIVLANIGGPAWFSWMGDIVDKEYRGRWFSKRNLIHGFFSVILALGAAFFLDYFKKNNWTIFGFIILFSLAFIARLLSWKTIREQYEPKIKLEKEHYFSFWEFLSKAPTNNFGKFTIFRAFFSFACAISGPLLVVYLLRQIQFSYTMYMIIILAGTVFSLMIMELWGKFADKYGNYEILFLTSILIPMIPILWILSPNPYYLIIIPSIIGGISWAGFNLASINFIYDNVTPQKRGLAVAYYNMLNGIGIFLGAGLGAILIQFLTISIIKPLFLIFIIGGIARIAVVVFWIPKIKETRKIKKFKSTTALKEIIFKEGKSTLIEEANQLISVGKYFKKSKV